MCKSLGNSTWCLSAVGLHAQLRFMAYETVVRKDHENTFTACNHPSSLNAGWELEEGS